MWSIAIEKLANLINYMQNLKPKLKVAARWWRCGLHGGNHVKGNYIPDFTVDSGCYLGTRRGAQGHRAGTLCCRARRHTLGYRRPLSPESMAVARDLENESGPDQESTPHLSGRRHHPRPNRARSTPADPKARSRKATTADSSRAVGSQAHSDHCTGGDRAFPR